MHLRGRLLGDRGHFVTFEAIVKGLFSRCRRIIGLDGCHLKSSTGCVLLSAISRDPINQMYHMAWVDVSIENKEK